MTKKLLTFLTLLTLFFGVGWAATGTIYFGYSSGDPNLVTIDATSVTGNDNLGNSWTITTTGTTSFTNSNNAGYSQVGSSKKPATSITFTTTLPSSVNVASMSAKFGGFNNTAGDITLKVGDTTIGTGSLDGANDVTVTSTIAATGTVLTVTVTNISMGVKCYFINYTYSEGGTPTPTHNIFYDDEVDGGSFSGPASAAEGATVSITATPEGGYEFGSWNVYKTGDTNTTVTVNNNQFTMPTYDVTVSGSFTEKTKYGITVTGGSASPTQAYEGQVVTLTPDIPTGKVIDWENTEVSPSTVVINQSDYTFIMPGEAVSVEFAFKNAPTYVFYEPFTGSTGYTVSGSDIFSGGAGNGTAVCVNTFGDFTLVNGKGAGDAIKLGKSGTSGSATTPTITGLTSGKTYILSFKAAPWASESATMSVTATGGTLTGLSTATMTTGQWNDFTATFVASSTEATFKFQASKDRFFLDEVMLDIVPETGYEIKRTIKTNGDASNEAGGWIGDWSNNCSYGEVSGNHYTVTAPAGETVQFKAGTNNGYNIFEDHVTAVDASGTPVTLTKVSSDNAGITFSFTMPASEVTITANFTSYAPDVYFLAGELSNWNNGTKMTYDVDARKYNLRVYFSDEYGYFRFRAGDNTYASGASGDYWPISENGAGESHFGDVITLYKGSSKRFRVPAGIYDIEVGRVFDDPDANNNNPGWWAETSVKVTKVEPELTFTPAAGELISGTTVTVSSDLYDLLHAINPDIAENDVTNMVKTNGDYAASVTLTAGATVTGRAKYGNIEKTADAAYTIHAFDTETPDYTEAFSAGFGKFFADNNTIWTIYNSSCARASAYFEGAATASESWLYSPYIDLTSASNPELSFSHSGNFFITNNQSHMADDVKVMIRELSNNEWSGWTALDGVTYPEGNNSNTFVDVEKSMTSYIGKTIQIAFKYTSTTERAGTWEIKNFKVANLYTITCNSADNGSITANPNPATAGETVTITVTPATGYELATLVYNDGTDHDIKDTKSFTMPAANVTVTATFEEQVIGANDFVLVKSGDPLVAGNEYIIVNNDFDKAMGEIDDNNYGTSCVSPTHFTISSDHETVTLTENSGVNILILREVEPSSQGADFKWALQQKKDDKYIYAKETGGGIADESQANFTNKFKILVNEGNYAIIQGTSGYQILYNNQMTKFRHYSTSNFNNSGYRKVLLYTRGTVTPTPTSISLANLCRTAPVNNEPIGEVGKAYTINEPLYVAYAKGNSIWVKDADGSSVVKDTPQDGDLNYEIVWAGNPHEDQRDYDQSNWLEVQLASGSEDISNLSGTTILANKITGTFTNKVNPTMTGVKLVEGDYQVTQGPSWTRNYYCTANFDGSQNATAGANAGKHFFFVKPKPQEYAQVVWAKYAGSGNTMEMPSSTEGNGNGFTGSFKFDLSLSGVNSLSSGIYSFEAIVRKAESKSDDYMVYPLGIQSVPTAVADVTGKTVAGVKYYNLAGMASDKPFDGVNIIVTTYTDGSRSSAKVLR